MAKTRKRKKETLATMSPARRERRLAMSKAFFLKKSLEAVNARTLAIAGQDLAAADKAMKDAVRLHRWAVNKRDLLAALRVPVQIAAATARILAACA